MVLGEVQSASYWTIVGRIDQFLLGILTYSLSDYIRGRHIIALVFASIFTTFYRWFAMEGGYYEFGSYPSQSSLWIFLPTIEGLAFGILIAWYDRSFTNLQGRCSNLLSRIGEYSYSIYLLHFFFVFDLAHYIHEHLLDLGNFYVATTVGLVAFIAMIPIGYVSMALIERPLLQLRVSYIRA